MTKCGTGARSINVDDINRVTGYNPAKTGDGKAYGAGNWYEYGNVVTYTSSGSTASNGKTRTGNLNYSVYYHPDGRQIGGTGGTQVSAITETSTYYNYYPHSLTTDSTITGTCNGISTSSKAYEMLFGTYVNTSTGKGNYYWLASSCVYTNYSASNFRMHIVDSNGYVNFCVMRNSSFNRDYGTSMTVRAVVAL